MLLQRRGKTYYLRVRVPTDLRDVIGRAEVKQTLRVQSHREAKTLARLKGAELERAYAKLRLGREAMDDKQLKRIADKLLAEILDTVERSRQQGTEAEELPLERWPEGYNFGNGSSYAGLRTLTATLSRQKTAEGLDEAERTLRGQIDVLRQELRLSSFSEYTRQIAKRRAEAEGIPTPPDSWFLPPGYELEYEEAGMESTWNERPPVEFAAVLRTVAQTLLEGHEIELERVGGIYSTERQIKAETRLMQAAKTYTLNDLWESFKGRRITEEGWTATTLEKYENFVVAVNRTVGEDFDFSVFEDVDPVTELIRQLKEYKSTRTNRKWSTATVNDCIVFLSTLHKYAIRNRKFGVTFNPFEGRQIAETGTKKREAFTAEELKRVWAGLNELKTSREIDKYWVMVLMLYTGARIGEVCQLRLDDLEKIGNHWVVVYQDRPELGQTIKHAKRKRKRGAEPKRVVPLHPDLSKLGFFAYVDKLKSAGEIKLFPNEKRTAGRSGVLMAKKIKTFLQKCIGKETEKSSHCFRHTLITWFNQNCNMTGTEERLLKAMVGHEDGDKNIGPNITWDVYGGENTVKQMYDLIKRLDFGLMV